MTKIGIYPGTFDPITNGHLNIIERSLNVLDGIIVGIARDVTKTPMFSLEERVEMVNRDVKILRARLPKSKTIFVESFGGLLVDFAKEKNASVIVRGLRAVSDFEYEFQLAATNMSLSKDVDTIFLPATEGSHFISSSMVREISRLGGDISKFVSPFVDAKLRAHFSSRKNEGSI